MRKIKNILCKGEVKVLVNINHNHNERYLKSCFDERDNYNNICLVFNNYTRGTYMSEDLNGRISYTTVPDEKEVKVYDLMSGEDFLEYVLEGMLTDYDGFVCNVFIDDYKSNMRLCAGYIGDCDDEGIVNISIDLWKSICKAHDVKVDWANK